MEYTSPHIENHYVHRVGWLRAAVLGANDGIVSTASLMLGFAATAASSSHIAFAGLAALVAGALSMAAGEFVSVSSQADTERADLATERQALIETPEEELDELTEIYKARGLSPALAAEVAAQLTRHDALGSHARDELGLTDAMTARPILAAAASALSFAAGAVLPLMTSLFVSRAHMTLAIAAVSMMALIGLGILSARAGGAKALRAAVRVGFWGAVAMAATWLVGSLFGVAA